MVDHGGVNTALVHETESLRRVLADLLGYPEHLIQFTEMEVGGGFGVRGEFYPEDFLVPWTRSGSAGRCSGSRTAAST